MKRKLAGILGILLLIVGIAVLLYPHMEREIYKVNVERLFQTQVEEYSEMELEELYLLMQEYNLEIYEARQSGLVDPFSYQEPSFNLNEWGIADNLVGFIAVPAMDIKLPLYLGANIENMRKGAVHLSNTSIPIGGINTNVVIAAHRGYYGAHMFQDIEVLKAGDSVYITNFWEELEYTVIETKVIAPSDIREVLIQEGKELVTLITCHPLRHNYQRYVVYCERVK